MGGNFVSEPPPFAKLAFGNSDYPGKFVFRDGAKITRDGNRYQGKLVVLVNENSQSQSEYQATVFKAVKNSVIIGSTTAGADSNVSNN
ncbi:MAG: S41 family peptidase [Pedobacter sp.]|uniref:S41 family peptidase n=1 Tax=Pedobacter sp. TaxID=1411316 RepID=UPI002809B9D5|nr:S41 family peptidase [Pedobacter sp.]MDQ8003591.1 S41 family peptidase [Pedobacter sp.]